MKLHTKTPPPVNDKKNYPLIMMGALNSDLGSIELDPHYFTIKLIMRFELKIRPKLWCQPASSQLKRSAMITTLEKVKDEFILSNCQRRI